MKKIEWSFKKIVSIVLLSFLMILLGFFLFVFWCSPSLFLFPLSLKLPISIALITFIGFIIFFTYKDLFTTKKEILEIHLKNIDQEIKYAKEALGYLEEKRNEIQTKLNSL